MDAAQLRFAPHQFDLILCRHLLWMLPDPERVLTRWAALLAPGGRLLLIEGFWHTGVGITADAVVAALPASLSLVTRQELGAHTTLWGSPVDDERYLLVVDKQG